MNSLLCRLNPLCLQEERQSSIQFATSSKSKNLIFSEDVPNEGFLLQLNLANFTFEIKNIFQDVILSISL